MEKQFTTWSSATRPDHLAHAPLVPQETLLAATVLRRCGRAGKRHPGQAADLDASAPLWPMGHLLATYPTSYHKDLTKQEEQTSDRKNKHTEKNFKN